MATSTPLFALSDVSAALDPKLASLFSPVTKSSATQPPHAKASTAPVQPSASAQSSQSDSDTDSSDESSQSHSSEPSLDTVPLAVPTKRKAESDAASSYSEQQQQQQQRRKRKRQDDDLEGRYLQKIAREEAKEASQRRAERVASRKKNTNGGTGDDSDAPSTSADEPDNENIKNTSDPDLEDQIPQHESLSRPEDDLELQKASRTVFLGNVSIAAMTSNASKRDLLNHLTSILPGSEPPPKVESLRFRSTAYSNAMPKKAAFARKDLMEATTKSTNAYAVYSTNQAAHEAAKQLNGTVILGRHLRVDQIAHPAKIDHRRCVFVGNLGFVDDESQIKANKDGEGKKTKPQKGDVEEGLWQQFAKAGKVESVRVVRDAKTRVGKGIAYVQFSDENSVEKALLYNDKKFPPLLPRKLRVVRAKKVRRDGSTGSKAGPSSKRGAAAAAANKPQASGTANEQTLRGRVKKLLGRAGAAQMRQAPGGSSIKNTSRNSTVKPPEAFVFEGHRASSTQGNRGLKLGGSHRKKGGKPKTRSAKRGAAWKAQGGTKRGVK